MLKSLIYGDCIQKIQNNKKITPYKSIIGLIGGIIIFGIFFFSPIYPDLLNHPINKQDWSLIILVYVLMFMTVIVITNSIINLIINKQAKNNDSLLKLSKALFVFVKFFAFICMGLIIYTIIILL